MKYRNYFRMIPITFFWDKWQINGRTGHVGLLEEEFLNRHFDFGDGNIIDCGANIGLFTLAAISSGAKQENIICIEPDPDNIVLLKKNFQKNNITCKILQVGVNSHSSIEPFISTSNGVGSHLGQAINQSMSKFEKIIYIKTETLDTIVDTNHIVPTFIKIDVEGHEIDVINGSKKILKKFKPTLLIELHKKSYFNKIKIILKKHGYTKFKSCYGDSLLCT